MRGFFLTLFTSQQRAANVVRVPHADGGVEPRSYTAFATLQSEPSRAAAQWARAPAPATKRACRRLGADSCRA